MGCGLRKLEDPEDSSPGKIFSTLKRPQVETKTEFAYEYRLLDFTLQASSNPEVIKIKSILDIVTKVEDYYLQGYIVGAVHPVIQAVGQQRHLPARSLYRAVLWRTKVSPRHSTAPGRQRRARLVIEEFPLTYEMQAHDTAKELIDKVNAAAKRGVRFVGFVSQHGPPPEFCNGTSLAEETEAEPMPSTRHDAHENCGSWHEGTLSGQSSESGTEGECRRESSAPQMGQDGSPNFSKSRTGEDNKLYAVYNVFNDDSTCWTYQEGLLSMKVTRKGAAVCTLDADWLELTTYYYKQGLSLIDSFVCWETPKGDYLPKSLEGLFIYEESSGDPGSSQKRNDAIIVEQWTVIEGWEIKSDYGPLLHTLAEFGWLLTSVLATPVLKHDREGNLATKQVVFLQRPVMWNSAAQTPEGKSNRPVKGESKNKLTNRSIGSDTATSRSTECRPQPEECPLSVSSECWLKGERAVRYSSFTGLGSSDSVLRELEDGQLDPEDGVTQVTCM
ncbi:raftlin-2 isoform X1 [Tenrec ecaudatus]|uniref:raftlin-2 isoform X1 n=1 Tax=Tenrec ecaudatus TaxID=94439 RepID=UPI003F590B8A